MTGQLSKKIKDHLVERVLKQHLDEIRLLFTDSLSLKVALDQLSIYNDEFRPNILVNDRYVDLLINLVVNGYSEGQLLTSVKELVKQLIEKLNASKNLRKDKNKIRMEKETKLIGRLKRAVVIVGDDLPGMSEGIKGLFLLKECPFLQRNGSRIIGKEDTSLLYFSVCKFKQIF